MADSKEEESDDGLSGVADFVQIYMISVDIIAAHNLVKADVMGKSDPYVIVSAFSTQYTTATIMKTLDPKWNERVELTFFNDPKKIKFQVMDWDKGTKDDPIGDCEFAISEDFYLPTNNGFHGKLKLQNVKRGELEIKVVARKLVPSELEEKLSSLQDAVESNTDKMQGLDTEIADLDLKNGALQRDIEGLNNVIADLNANIPTLKEEQQKLEKQEETLDAEEKEANSALESAKETLSEVQDELKGLNKEIEDVKVEEDKVYNEIERIKEQIEDEKKRKEQQEKAAAAAKEEKDKDVSTPLVPDKATREQDDTESSKCCMCVCL